MAGIVALSICSCSEDQTKKPQAPSDVNVVAAGKENIPVYSEFVGQTYGLSDINIDPRIDGWITGIFFKEGSQVQKGSLLYTIDDQPSINRVDAAKADLAKAQTLMENQKAEVGRVKPLADLHALSQRDLDFATANYEAALNEVKVAESRVANAQIDLSYTRITAPITGIIGISKVQVGEYVNRTTLGTGINSISSLGDVRVRFELAEGDYLRFKQRNETEKSELNFARVPVELIFGDGSVYKEKGSLQLFNRQVDANTGTILVQAIFKNPDGLLRPGQYVKVRFKTEEFTNAIVIPQQAVNQMQNIYQVFLLTDSNTIKPQIIKVGSRVGSNWIVTDGLKEGNKVVIVGSTALNSSTKVNPRMISWNYDSTSRN
jgi:membrane fusion protein (multidrug efflux system)